MLSFCAQASCANGLSTLMPMTSAFRSVYAPSPAVMSHNSPVQTPVKASGTNNSTVFLLPKLLLRVTSVTSPLLLDFSVKSGALVPTSIAMFFSC